MELHDTASVMSAVGFEPEIFSWDIWRCDLMPSVRQPHADGYNMRIFHRT